MGPRQRNNQSARDFGSPNPTIQRRPNTSNSGIVPMEVDAANTTPTRFVKLTPEERAQLAKEGRCFRCRLQGHMARECPKNLAPRVRTTTSPPSTTTTPAPTNTNTPTTTAAPAAPPPVPPPKPPKLTRAQQIRALEEAMNDEERSQYLDARDMGEDFWSAGN